VVVEIDAFRLAAAAVPPENPHLSKYAVCYPLVIARGIGREVHVQELPD